MGGESGRRRRLPSLRQGNNYSISVEVARIVCYSVSRPLTARYARMTWDWNGDGGKTLTPPVSFLLVLHPPPVIARTIQPFLISEVIIWDLKLF